MAGLSVASSPVTSTIRTSLALSQKPTASQIRPFSINLNSRSCRNAFARTCRNTFQVRSSATQALSTPQSAIEFESWLKSINGFPEQVISVGSAGELGQGCFLKRPAKAGETLISIPENFTVSSFDVLNHPVVAEAAQGRSELVGLTLWLMHERSKGSGSIWAAYLHSLPETTLSPLLWEPAERESLLQGSPALREVTARVEALEAEFASLKSDFFDKSPELFPEETYSVQKFKEAFSVVLSRVIYLANVDILALVPLADCVNHKSDSKSSFDFSLEDNSVVLRADREYKEGEQIWCSYGSERSNADFLISYGFVPKDNSSDFVELTASLVQTDRLFGMKKNIIEEAGFSIEQPFPLFEDRLPAQLLTYVRLARLQDPGLFIKVTFDRDAPIDEANEYETLVLLIGECREKLAAYKDGLESDLQLLKKRDLSEKERTAALLRLGEKKILTAAMGALRTRLAPIRGIPTKSGMQDPNSDIKEMFGVMEAGFSAPRRLLSSIFGKSTE